MPALTPFPLLAMRAAILTCLGSDATLLRLMGGSLRLYDEPPRGSAPVYALFGAAETRDDSVAGATRHTHTLRLVVYAKPGSARTGLDAAERMAALLADANLAVRGQTLVLCRAVSLAAERDARSGDSTATLTVEAVTEAA